MKRLLTFVLMFIIASALLAGISYGADEERFILSDLVVKDKEAWLIWIRDANVAGKEMTWDDASKFVKKLNEQKYAGLQCWRFPTKEELLRLIAYAESQGHSARNVQINELLSNIGFKNVQGNLYWSSTPYAGSDVWVVYMSLGSVSGVSKTGFHYIWPVCDYDKGEREREEKKKKEAVLAAELAAKQKEREERLEAQKREMEKEQERLKAQKKREEEQKKLDAQIKKDEEKSRKQREAIRQQRKAKLDQLLPKCNGKILSHEDFLLGKNPYADKGKCVEFSAATFQMTSTNTGLFYIANNELAFIEFKETFRGSGVQGIAKIKGLYNYTTRSGISNQVPHLEMLKIEKILGR